MFSVVCCLTNDTTDNPSELLHSNLSQTSPIQTVNSIVTNDVRQRCQKTAWVKSSSMEVLQTDIINVTLHSSSFFISQSHEYGFTRTRTPHTHTWALSADEEEGLRSHSRLLKSVEQIRGRGAKMIPPSPVSQSAQQCGFTPLELLSFVLHWNSYFTLFSCFVCVWGGSFITRQAPS